MKALSTLETPVIDEAWRGAISQNNSVINHITVKISNGEDTEPSDSFMKENGRDFLNKLVTPARKVYTPILDQGNHFKICY